MKLKCIIIDDDNFAIEAIKKTINSLPKHFPLEVIKTFDNAIEAINEINNIDFNLLFIDYEMPGYTGIEVVKRINTDKPVIFVSSYTEKSIDITNEVNIVGFLTKPPEKEALENIIKNKNLLITAHNKMSRIIIPDGKKEYFFNKEDIYYIKSDKKYKDFFDKSNNVIKSIVISFIELESLINNKGFERISKSYLINVSKIKEKTLTYVILTNEKKIHIGESQKSSFLNNIKNWFK